MSEPTPSRRLSPCHTSTVHHHERDEGVTFAWAVPAQLGSASEEGVPLPAWLGPLEMRYATGLKFAKRRREFLLGRLAAKSALVTWLHRDDMDLNELDIVAGAFQQPIVHGGHGANSTPTAISLAHSGELAVAVAHDQGHPMGIDLERHDPARIEVVRTLVAAKELPAERWPLAESELYFLIWSAKEALSKALRCGLTCPFEVLATTDVHVDATGVCTGVFSNFGQYQFFGWMLGDYTFAVVGSRNAAFGPHLEPLRRFMAGAVVRATPL